MIPIAERSSSEIFTGKPWQVPLYGRPTDSAAVARLLQAVLCGSAACLIRYSPGSATSIARY